MQGLRRRGRQMSMVGLAASLTIALPRPAEVGRRARLGECADILTLGRWQSQEKEIELSTVVLDFLRLGVLLVLLAASQSEDRALRASLRL